MNRIVYIIFLLLLMVSCGKTEGTEEKPSETILRVSADAPVIEKATQEQPPVEDDPSVIDPIEEYINNLINGMSLEEKTGQMFICAFRDKSQGTTEINAVMKKTLSDYHVGGVVLFSENIHSKSQTAELIADLQNESEIPLFIAVDEEGGSISRLSTLGYEKLPAASVIGSSGDSKQAFEQGRAIAVNLKELGFNLDFAPVADINTNKLNPIVGSRAFSSNPEIAGEMVREFVNGLQDEGIIATLKHFPGHGDTYEDSHDDRAIAKYDINSLNEKELVPFRMGIEAGVEFVMAGHISAPNVTNNEDPAIFSYKLISEILREQMGFDGIIITDALDMGAITKHYDSGETAVKAVLAGVDILLMPENLDQAFNGLLNAVLDGVVSESRINESLNRILRTKIKYGIIEPSN